MSDATNLISDLPRLESTLVDIFNGRSKQVLSRNGMVTAAVLIALFDKDGRPHVLLTKRSNKVEHHKGEISFPGGKLDDTDPDLLSCALRETFEELGVDPSDVRVLGEMDDFYTVATNYLVVPFVGVIPFPYHFTPSWREIDEVLCVPMDVFFDPDAMSAQTWMVHGAPLEVIFYQWEGRTIWGATARMLQGFAELVKMRM